MSLRDKILTLREQLALGAVTCRLLGVHDMSTYRITCRRWITCRRCGQPVNKPVNPPLHSEMK